MGRRLAKVGRVLRAPMTIAGIIALILALMIWFIGPLIVISDQAILADTPLRLGIILAIAACWGLANLLIYLFEERANAKLLEEFQHQQDRAREAEEADDATAREELAAIRHRAQAALGLLRQKRFAPLFGKRRLYQLPWYLVIGPPGSGKTTALVNSGLTFPLAGEMGRAPVSGLGGTRLCDWWLTDQAVLIDTAGRYTSQDSRERIDRSVWSGLLALLKRLRRLQPINGAIVVLSLPELAAASERARAVAADTIRRRIVEAQGHLGVRLPIYVLFSKLDLVSGFSDFFETLGREERSQVWGFTFPFDDGRSEQGAVEAFADSFSDLISRLGRRVLQRVQEEPDPARRRQIYEFPAQLAALNGPAADFLKAVFSPNRFDDPLLLRGYYLTSAVQEGTPYDLIAPLIAPSFGFRPGAPEAGSAQNRSFFLTRLFAKVIFPEASLVGLDARLARLRRLGIAIGAVAAVMAAATLTVLWSDATRQAQALVSSTLEAAGRLDDRLAVHEGALPPVSSISWAWIDQTLNPLCATARPDQRPCGTIAPESWGLYDRSRLTDASTALYLSALTNLLRPKLLELLEQTMADRRTGPAMLYQTLKVYLMLGHQGPLDSPLVAAWFASAWDQQATTDISPGLKTALGWYLDDYLKAFAASTLAPADLDPTKIAKARAQLSDTTTAERGYQLIKDSDAAKALLPWRVIDNAGPAGAKVLLRPSGIALNAGIDGFFTRSGFFDVFLPQLPEVSSALAKEGWVLGAPDTPQAVSQATKRLHDDMLALYLDDYTKAWDELLGDVTVVPFRSPAHAGEVLTILGGNASPLKRFYGGVASETDLDINPNAPPEAAKSNTAGVLADQAANKASSKLSSLPQLSAAAAADLAARVPPGHPVTVHFKALQDFVKGADGQPPGIDGITKTLADLGQTFSRLARLPPGATPGNGPLPDPSAPLAALAAAVEGVPPGAHSTVSGVAVGATAVATGRTRDVMDLAWKAKILPLCRTALEGRFPFAASATVDAPIDDVTALLAPGGLIDQFFNSYLKPYVDMSGQSWQWQTVDGLDLGLPPAVLADFQHLATIRDAYFPPQGKTPLIKFDLTPDRLDDRVNQLSLSIDEQVLLYEHGPVQTIAMQWPSQLGPTRSTLTLMPGLVPDDGIEAGGTWGFFHLLDQGHLTELATPDQFRLVFTSSAGRQASFLLHAASVNNPFALRDQGGLQCPSW